MIDAANNSAVSKRFHHSSGKLSPSQRILQELLSVVGISRLNYRRDPEPGSDLQGGVMLLKLPSICQK